MSNYIKLTDFAAKDSLLSGDPAKIVKGSEINAEFDSIQTNMATKADTLSPVFSGTPTAATAPVSTDTAQLATTAFVQDVREAERSTTTTLTNKTLVSPKVDVINEATPAAGVTIDGVLLKDGVVTASLTGNVTGNASTVTTITSAQVAGASAGVSVGEVGTYAFLIPANATLYAAGATLAGSSLRYANNQSQYNTTDGVINASGTPAGIWRCMGWTGGNGTNNSATMWLRIS